MIIGFDFDGTLVDSYSIIEEAFKKTLEKSFPLLPFKSLWAKILTLIEYYYEKPKFGKNRVKQPIIFKIKFFRMWFEERAKLSKPIDNSKELLKRLKEEGYKVISFSAEDFADGMKEYRLKITGYYDLFDDVIVWKDDKRLLQAFQYIRNKYGNDIFIWVDDKPWRFIGKGDERTVFVWYRFPITSKFVNNEILDKIPNLYVIDSLWDIFDVIEDVKRSFKNL